jgi:hypothetical protein
MIFYLVMVLHAVPVAMWRPYATTKNAVKPERLPSLSCVIMVTHRPTTSVSKLRRTSQSEWAITDGAEAPVRGSIPLGGHHLS